MLCGMLGLSAFVFFMWVLVKIYMLKEVIWSITLKKPKMASGVHESEIKMI